MKSIGRILALTGIALSLAAVTVHAGTLRATARGIHHGSAALAVATTDAAGSVANGVSNAGRSTGDAVKSGAASTGKGVVAAPGLAARGAVSAGKAVGKAVW